MTGFVSLKMDAFIHAPIAPEFVCECGRTFDDSSELLPADAGDIADPGAAGKCGCGRYVYDNVNSAISDHVKSVPSIQARFAEFHREHPEVYEYLFDLTVQLRSRGFSAYGIGSLWERLRWHFQVDRGLDEEFKLNNNYRSRYVRMMLQEHPELDGFFEVRKLRAK